MSSLLDKSSRPRWVWILVIVVGSLAVLAITTFLVRFWLRRRWSRLDVEYISDEPAEKQLTLRRGRTVPATSYLSLTGSRFGIGSYGFDEGLQSPSIRSKSPFEWWTNLRGRSSRLSYVSHSSTPYPSSPRPGSLYGRPDLSTSKLSLTSKDESIRATITEIKIAKPQPTLMSSFKRSSRNFEPVNFSRSFTPQTQRSLAAFRNQTLSRIEETTSRHSALSNLSLRGRKESYTPSENGQAFPTRASTTSLLQVPNPQRHSRKPSNLSIRELTMQDQMQDPSPSFPSSPYLSPSPVTPTFPVPPTSMSTSTYHAHSVSQPMMPSPSLIATAVTDNSTPPQMRNSLWTSSMKQFPSLEQRSNSASMVQVHPLQMHGHGHGHGHSYSLPHIHSPAINSPFHFNDQSQRQSSPQPQIYSIQSSGPTSLLPTALTNATSTTMFSGLQISIPTSTSTSNSDPDVNPDPLQNQPPPPPKPTRPSSGPLRTRSKKGNVLRKKSLQRVDLFA